MNMMLVKRKMYMKMILNKYKTEKKYGRLEIKMPKELIGNFKHGKDEIESQDETNQVPGDLNDIG